MSEKILPVIEIGDLELNLETAILCGLIINELITNSLKYAFPNTEIGEVHVSLNWVDNKYELIISDNGIGFPKDIDFKNTNSLGLQLVNNIIFQLEGEIKLDKSVGTKFTINFENLITS